MTLELYKFDECPYVQRVMRYIKESGRTDIIYRDINEDKEAEQTLITLGGKRQVPACSLTGSRCLKVWILLSGLESIRRNNKTPAAPMS